VGLVARAIEARGIPTVVVASVRARALGSRPPRLLVSGDKNAEVIGAPNDRQAQLVVLRAALRLLVTSQTPGALDELPRRA
jgi:hypothetical protein